MQHALHVLFCMNSEKDVQLANIEANGRLVFRNGYIQNITYVLKYCLYTDFCLVEANSRPFPTKRS